MKSLFTLSSDHSLTWDEVEHFCALGISEATRVEYKSSFPSNLEKSISAFANTFGGVIIIGVEADQANRPKTPIAGIPFSVGYEERVRQICNNSMYPPVWPSVWVVRHSDKNIEQCVVVVRVDESDTTPHSINGRTEIYLRTGNVSQPVRRADVSEIQDMLTRRKDAIERRKTLENRFSARANFFIGREQGKMRKVAETLLDRAAVWTFLSMPLFPRSHIVSLDGLRSVVGRLPLVCNTQYGLTALIGGSLRSAQESFIITSGGKCFQYLEANQFGLVGYGENTDLGLPPTLNPFSIRQRILAILFLLPKFYEGLGFSGLLKLRMRLMGVQGYKFSDTFGSQQSEVCPDEEVRWEDEVRVDDVKESPEQVFFDVVRNLHAAFGWTDNIESHLRKEVQEARVAIQGR